MKLPLLVVTWLTGLALTSYAQMSPGVQWHHLDPMTDRAIGISTERAYQLLKTLPTLAGPRSAQSQKPVIVAVIDAGLDVNHEDLKSVLWTNPKEVAGNGKDDDGNGYVDDLHGWNFMGNKDGQNLEYLTKEETRLYAQLQPRYGGNTDSLEKTQLSPAQRRELTLWKVVKPYFESRRADALRRYRRDSVLLAEDQAAMAQMKQVFGVSRIDTALLHYPSISDTTVLRLARFYYRDMVQRGLGNSDEYLIGHQWANARMKVNVDYAYNPTYNAFARVGDNPDKLTEREYGNATLMSSLTYNGSFHGTHVAGILAADRTNNLGVKGIADGVRILAVRAAPTGGDERDKDVANAIRYAVDNGAQIINMSFGKYFSPDKAVVDEAIRYADRQGVLLVHGAGNDHLDLDSATFYPSPRYLNGQLVPNLITVGASGQCNDSTLAAPFSNYGKQGVDLFAPGVQIWSCDAGNKYRSSLGTSMATPMVTGVAAVLKTYFPHLKPADLKRIILQSAVVYHTPVLKPGTQQRVDFASLSKSGGIVNLYEAVKLAMREESVKKRLPSQKD